MPVKTNTDPHNVFLQARRFARLSQESLATAVGVSRQAIGQLEHGKRQPKTAELLKLATVLRVRPELLMANVDLMPCEPEPD